MAHNLASHNGNDSFFSLRESPWHNLGTIVNEPVSHSEVAKLAGLDWEAKKVDLFTKDNELIETHQGIQRSDDKRMLGVVGKKFEVLQNAELFEFFRSASGIADPVIETAGALGQGETVWALAKMDFDMRIGDDVSTSYLLISNGHIGNRVVTVMPTQVRVVCQNTLQIADKGKAYKLRHTSGMRTALDDIAQIYSKSADAFRLQQQASEYLAKVPMTSKMMNAYFASVFEKDGPDETKRSAAMRRTRESKIQAILASPTSQVKGTKDSAYSLFHSVVEYVDHFRSSDHAKGFASANFGSGAQLKKKAWDAILAQ